MTLKQFLLVATPEIDRYVSATGNESAYTFLHGEKRGQLKLAFESVSKYFDGFCLVNTKQGNSAKYWGIGCRYGTMPCLVTMQFVPHCMWMSVYRVLQDSYGPSFGARLYEVEVRESGVMESGHFENILK